MPTPVSQLPAGPNDLARRLAALEREVREMRAARRAAYTALTTGAMKLTDADGEVLAEMTADFNGMSGFVAYATRQDQEYYAALSAGDLHFGVTGETDTANEGRVSFSLPDERLFELMMSSGSATGISASQINLYSATGIAAGDSHADITTDRVNIFGLLAANNLVWGVDTITPSASNTPTSLTINSLNLPGSSFYGLATASSSLPGTAVTGVGVTNVTSSSITLWLTRTNTTPTPVFWMATGQ